MKEGFCEKDLELGESLAAYLERLRGEGESRPHEEIVEEILQKSAPVFREELREDMRLVKLIFDLRDQIFAA